MIRITGDADHFTGLPIHPGPDAALGPAAKALGHRYRLLWISLPAGCRMAFRDQRVTENAVQRDFAGGAVDQSVKRAFHHVPVTQPKYTDSTQHKPHF